MRAFSVFALEVESTFAFQGARWLADVAPQLLDEALRARVEQAKAMAVVRQQAEAELPKHLLFAQGWPISMPTLEEAELIASVRRRVGRALNFTPQFVSAADVLERYRQLLAQRNGAVATKREEELEDTSI